MKLLRVALQKLVGHIRHLTLGLHGFFGMIHGQAEDHLALPERDGVDDGGADLLGHEGVVVLNHTDLRRHLQRDRTRQLKVVYLLLKAADHIGKVVRSLRVLGQAGLLSLALQFGKLDIPKLFDAHSAGNDIHCQLFHVFLVLLIHFVHQADVLEKNDFVALKLLDDLVDVYLGLVILGLDGSDILLGLVEQTEQALFLLRVKVHALEFDNEIAEHIADLAEVFAESENSEMFFWALLP